MPNPTAVLPLVGLDGLRLGWHAACAACGWSHTRLDHPEEDGLRLVLEALADAHAEQHTAAADRLTLAQAAALNDAGVPLDACTCLLSCADDPASACSRSGTWHTHPSAFAWDGLGPCPVHPEAPGDI